MVLITNFNKSQTKIKVTKGDIKFNYEYIEK